MKEGPNAPNPNARNRCMGIIYVLQNEMQSTEPERARNEYVTSISYLRKCTDVHE